MEAHFVSMVNATRNTVLGNRIRVANGSFSRAIGLLGQRSLAPDSGLWIVPSQGVHTVGMQFAIDVVFVDRDWRVIYLRESMRPFRATRLCWRARGVLELPPGTIAQTSTVLGDELEIRDRADV